MSSLKTKERHRQNNKKKGVLQTQSKILDYVTRFRCKTTKGDVACPLFYGKGSLTVEAALILPLFLLASLTLLSFIDVIRFTNERQMQHQEWLRTGAVYAAFPSYAAGGRKGDDITLDYVYPAELPIGGFGLRKVLVRQKNRVHIFNGYDDSRGDCIGATENLVYITKYGTVYHQKRSCPALNVSIEKVSGTDVGSRRNIDRKIYRKCKECAKGYSKQEIKKMFVYITESGIRYHVRINCHELTRTVQVIKISQAGRRLPCKLCG